MKPYPAENGGGLSRSELRAAVLLLAVLALLSWLVCRALCPAPDPVPEAVLGMAPDSSALRDPGVPEHGLPADADGTGGPGDSLFRFDPNTVEFHDLCRLGFSRGEALAIVRLRSSGKRFSIPEDLAACRAVSEEMYRRLLPYIDIAPEFRLRPRSGVRRPGNPQKEAPQREPVPQLVPFLADTAGAEFLSTLGFTRRQAEAVVRYREASGGFADAGAFARCYVVSEEMAARLAPYLIFSGRSGASGREPERSSLAELNGLDSAGLAALDGIGPLTAGRIAAYRSRLGGFVRKEQLSEVQGVTERNYEKIIGQIWVDSCKIRKIDINFAPPEAMYGHPYIAPEKLRKLLRQRQLKGGWSTLGDIVNDKIWTQEEAARVAPYLRFGRREDERPAGEELR